MVDMTPYSTAKKLMGPLPTWVSPYDAERLSAYAVYESIYRNVPEAFKLVQRGSDASPIYLPSAKTLIEAKNRFFAREWTYAIDALAGTDTERAELDTFLASLFARESIKAKFSTQKRYGMVRGDAVWHIVGDPLKAEGSRLSIYEVDPASYFPIYDPWNPDKIRGVHLVDQVLNAEGKTIIKRQTWRKTDTGRISYELSWWESGAWDDREGGELKKAESKDIPAGEDNVPVPPIELDPRITALPVYHVKNNRTPGVPYGTSELAGYETLISGINQSISDEDLALALEGIGLYWTNSGPPTVDDGNGNEVETTWKIGPGRVVELDPDATWERVSGITSVQPYQDHMTKLESSMREAAGVPDVAVGIVDAAVAESGIALALKMSPLVSDLAEKELELLGKMDQLLFDLVSMWLPVYESVTTDARAASQTGERLPTNRKAVLDEIVVLVTNKMISVEYAVQLVNERLGYTIPKDVLAKVVEEQASLAGAADPYAARSASELADAEEEAAADAVE